jgi:hypothetical protein
MFDWSNAPIATNDDVKRDYAPIPAGKYRAIIGAVQDKDTKAGTGKYFNIELIIHGDRYDGCKVWDLINYINPNPKAVEIGFRTLRAIGAAAGMSEQFDPQDLQDKCVEIEIGIESQPGFEPKNKVKKYYADGTAAAPAKPTYAPQGSNDDADVPF